jgi:hypothetical protein
LAEKNFKLDTSAVKVCLKKLSLERKHFNHIKRMISLMKKKKAEKDKSPIKKIKHFPLNHSMFYICKNVENISTKRQLLRSVGNRLGS